MKQGAKQLSGKAITLVCPLVFLLFWSFDCPAQKSILIAGARIVDGTGRPAFLGDVRIVGNRIADLGKLQPRLGEVVVLAEGMVLAPGFIDIHNHSQEGLDREPEALTQISQGITTLALGPDGSSAFPVGEYLRQRESHPTTVNTLTFVGHATVRHKVLGEDFRRPSTASEIRAMQALVAQGMREGAWGLSTGLEYDIGFQSTTEEVIALARVAARYKGIYMSHIRDEADRAFEALEEAIRIGREARIPVQISHIKLGTVGVWGQAAKAVELLQGARSKGVDITADCYPYDAWSSTITVLVPSRKFEDPIAVKKGLEDVGGAANVLITHCQAYPEYERRTLEAIAAARSMTPDRLFSEIVREGGASVICCSMQESDIQTFYRQPWIMVASDGGIGMRHPRGAGTFPRVLGYYVRQKKWLSLEDAVRKMTSMPALRLKLDRRGLIHRGYFADLVLLDSSTVLDGSTFQEPLKLSTGIRKVYVNGLLVWDGAGATAARPGRVLRHR
jgi:N-acyl-D-amino-acid deacylase